MMRHSCLKVVATGLMLLGSSALAQINSQLVSPSANDFFYVASEAYSSSKTVEGKVGFSVDYANLPLELRYQGGDMAVISHLVTADLALRLDFLQRFRLELNLPMNWSSQLDEFSLAGMGDARAGFQMNLLDPTSHRLGMAVRSFAVLPTGNLERHLGEDSVSLGALGILHRSQGRVGLSASFGAVRVRPDGGAGLPGDRWMGSLGLTTLATPRLRLGCELFGSTDMRAPFASEYETPLEILPSIRYVVQPGVTASLGIGLGLDEGVGEPRARGILGLVMALPVRRGAARVESSDQCPEALEDVDGFQDSDGCPDPDNDGDGILDAVDLCPDLAEDRDGFMDRDGCPDLDDDEDGIADAQDQCPREAEDLDGFEDDDGCPDLDNDRDGTSDVFDLCPNQKEDFDHFEDLDGCPDYDHDGDGIPEAEDLCPEEAETKNGFQDDDGCPDIATLGPQSCGSEMTVDCVEELLARGLRHPIELVKPQRFAFNSAALSPETRAFLDQESRKLREIAKIWEITLVGHCDEIGTDDYNYRLSVQRAKAVRAYLIRKGVEAHSLVTIGRGRTQPRVRGDSVWARSQNRRVELWLMEDIPWTTEQLPLSMVLPERWEP